MYYHSLGLLKTVISKINFYSYKGQDDMHLDFFSKKYIISYYTKP